MSRETGKGFPTHIPEGYIPPTRAQLFSVPTEAEKERAICANRAYNEFMAQQEQKEHPTPLSLLDTAFGFDLVEAIFGRIDAGVYR